MSSPQAEETDTPVHCAAPERGWQCSGVPRPAGRPCGTSPTHDAIRVRSMSPHATIGLPPSDLAWPRRHPSRGKPFIKVSGEDCRVDATEETRFSLQKELGSGRSGVGSGRSGVGSGRSGVGSGRSGVGSGRSGVGSGDREGSEIGRGRVPPHLLPPSSQFPLGSPGVKPMHFPDKLASTVGRPSKRSWRNRNSTVKFARK